jgi:hypothetical protein
MLAQQRGTIRLERLGLLHDRLVERKERQHVFDHLGSELGPRHALVVPGVGEARQQVGCGTVGEVAVEPCRFTTDRW